MMANRHNAIGYIARPLLELYSVPLVLLAAAFMPSGQMLADGFVRGPVSGLVHNAGTRTIHRIDGIPGAATLSQPIAIDIDVQAAAFDRAQRFALVVNSEGAVFLVRDPAGESPRIEGLDGAIDQVELIALDNGGSRAGLYSPARHTLQLIEGLPDSPRVALTTNLGEATGAGARLLTMQPPDGALLVSEHDGQSTIFRISSDGVVTPLAPAGVVRSLLATGAGSFVFADSARNELVKVVGTAAGAETTVLANASNGVNDPRAVCPAVDGGLVLLNAGGESPAALTFDAEGRPSGNFALFFEPQRCEAPGAGPFLLMNNAGHGPLYLLDPAENQRVMFVPPTAAGEGKQ